MKLQKLLTLSVLLASVSTGVACAAANYNYQAPAAPSYSAQNPLQGQVTYVPRGATVPAILSSPISSETMNLGSSVSATLPEAFIYGGKTIAPAGSMIYGSVTVAKAAGRANRNGQILVRFNSIVTPQGFNIPISAVIATEDGSGLLKGGTAADATKDFAKNTAIGAAGGAILGTAMGPLSGGSVGKGAIYGTAVGAGLGLLKGVAVDKGDTVEIPANSRIDIYFDQPVTMASPKGYGY